MYATVRASQPASPSRATIWSDAASDSPPSPPSFTAAPSPSASTTGSPARQPPPVRTGTRETHARARAAAARRPSIASAALRAAKREQHRYLERTGIRVRIELAALPAPAELVRADAEALTRSPFEQRRALLGREPLEAGGRAGVGVLFHGAAARPTVWTVAINKRSTNGRI